MKKDANNTRDFYDAKMLRSGCCGGRCGSKFLSVYIRSPYLFAENYLKNKLKVYGEGARLLDVCCGSGGFSVDYALLGYNVDGVDISPASIDKAIELAKKNNVIDRVNFVVQDVGQTLDFPDESFDVVFISGSLFYLDYEKIIPEILRVLKKNGTFVCIGTNGDNFIMNFVRRIKNVFLRYRDQHTISNLLKFKDVDKILKFFPEASFKCFDFFVLAGCLFKWNSWLMKKWTKLASILDSFLFDKLGIKKLCFKFVIIGKK